MPERRYFTAMGSFALVLGLFQGGLLQKMAGKAHWIVGINSYLGGF